MTKKGIKCILMEDVVDLSVGNQELQIMSEEEYLIQQMELKQEFCREMEDFHDERYW